MVEFLASALPWMLIGVVLGVLIKKINSNLIVAGG